MNHNTLKKFEEQCRKQLNVTESGYLNLGDYEVPYFKGTTDDGRIAILSYHDGDSVGYSYTKLEEEKFIGDWKSTVISSFAYALKARKVEKERVNEPTS